MKNVITFPEKRMRPAKKQQKARTYQAVLSLSLVSLMMGALIINDSVNRSQSQQILVTDTTNASDLQNLNRAIASAHPMNPFRDLEWEKKMAKRLGQSNLEDRTPASVGRNVTSVDQLRFGALAGKYRLLDRSAAGGSKVQEISYVESSEVNDRPVFLDPQQFLKDYGSLLSVDFALFDRANNPRQEQIREYRLMNSNKQVVGTAAFIMDDEGRFISLKVRSASENSQ